MLDRATLQPRLLRCLYGLGTNAGLKRVLAGDPSFNYHDLFYIRRRYIHKDALRDAIAPRRQCHLCRSVAQTIWGEGTTVVCLGCQEVWGVGSESHDRMAHPLRGPRGHDLLACGEKVGLYLFPTQTLFVL